MDSINDRKLRLLLDIMNTIRFNTADPEFRQAAYVAELQKWEEPSLQDIINPREIVVGPFDWSTDRDHGEFALKIDHMWNQRWNRFYLVITVSARNSPTCMTQQEFSFPVMKLHSTLPDSLNRAYLQSARDIANALKRYYVPDKDVRASYRIRKEGRFTNSDRSQLVSMITKALMELSPSQSMQFTFNHQINNFALSFTQRKRANNVVWAIQARE